MKCAKLPKIKCEIAGCNITDENALEYHHVIEQCEIGTDNNPWNLVVLCSTHHSLVTYNKLKIIGPYPSTENNGRLVIYELDGVSNFPGITEAYYKPKPKGLKIQNKGIK